MISRDKFDFPDYYPFGVEIEICNKYISDVYDICEERPELILVDKNWQEICDLFDEDYAEIMTYKNKFALKKNENSYWRFSQEDVNEEDIGLGIELSSPILYNKTQCLEDLWEVLKIYEECGSEVNELCGVHIHMGARPFMGLYQKLLNFFLFYLYYEPVFYKLSAMGNFGHVREYAMSYANPVVFQMFDDIIDERVLKRYIDDNKSSTHKENALHFNGFRIDNYQYGSSFEARPFNGTLDRFVISNYISATMSSLYHSVGDDFNRAEMIKKCREAIKQRADWRAFDDFVDNADQLVDEFIEKVFSRQLDKDLFYEQYSGKYLRKTMSK